jgi:transcriptional regulator with XRE-family HTH domain
MMQLEFCPKCKSRLVPRPADVKRLRQLAGITQRQLSAMLGVEASHITYLESGQRNPSGDLILRYRAVEKQLLRKAEMKRRTKVRAAKRRSGRIRIREGAD